MTNLADLLLEHPFADDEPLLHEPGRSFTAGEARALVRQGADRLRAQGLLPGRAVALTMPNSLDAVVGMFAVWAAGGVFVPVNPRYPEAEVDRVIATTRPQFRWSPPDAPAPTALDGDPTEYEAGTAFVMWTSGTTGAPKAALHAHEAYLGLLDRVIGPLRGRERDPARPPSPNLIPVSMALNAGIYNALFGLRAGAPLVLIERFEPAVYADVVRRFGIRSTVLPPAAMAMLTDDPEVTDLGPLKYLRSITAPLSALQATRFHEKFGVAVLNGYGQAEIGEVIGWTAADWAEHGTGPAGRLGAAGRPHKGVVVRVVDPEGAEVPVGTVGELLVLPPNRTSSYASGEAVDDRLAAEGFWRTGDMARIDEDGFVWIEGRVGDMINRGGNKVFPDQVEEVVRLHPGVADAAVVAAPDDRLGEVPVAVVVPVDPAAPPSTDELTALCRERLVAYKVPAAWRFVDDLPRNDAGKLRRAEIARGLLAD
jgi:acyl-coenzyme A synthetase/AMP-(fatty) acid ligase